MIALACLIVPALSGAGDASVFVYQRFGDGGGSGAVTRTDQLEAHVRELSQGAYEVMPLAEIVSALEAGRTPPEGAVAITVDNAHRSFARIAWPRFREYGIPVTVFISSDTIDGGRSGTMGWDELRALRAEGLELGTLSASYIHLARLDREALEVELGRTRSRFSQMFGSAPRHFAYPYGEASLEVRDAVIRAGFRAAFGSHSGVAHGGGDLFFLPRFPMSERFASLSRFRQLARALPLPVRDITPTDMLVGPDANPPAFGFSVVEPLDSLMGLACYSGSQGRLTLETLGTRRVELRFSKPFPPGRQRVNCTMPGLGGRHRWFGRQFTINP